MSYGLFGLNIHPLKTYGRQYSAAEKTELFDAVNKLQSNGHVVMDWPDTARQIKRDNPACMVVNRVHTERDGDLFNMYTPQAFYDKYAPYSEGGRFVVQALNEPSGYGDLPRLADWMAKTFDLWGAAGLPLLAPGWGEGNPDIVTSRLSELKPMFEAYDKWRDVHIWHIHEYGTHDGMIVTRPGYKYNTFPWRVGRFNNFTVPFVRDVLKLAVASWRVFVGEYGIDDAHDGVPNSRFWQDCGWSEEKYADELEAGANLCYIPAVAPVRLIGAAVYCWGNSGRQLTSQDWRQADISGKGVLLGRLARFNANLAAPQPPAQTPPTQPPPTNPGPTQPPPVEKFPQTATIESPSGIHKAGVSIDDNGTIHLTHFKKS